MIFRIMPVFFIHWWYAFPIMTKISLLAACTALLGSACSYPKTKPDFLEYAHSKMDRETFTVEGVPYPQVEKLLAEFSGRCLQAAIVSSPFRETFQGSLDVNGDKISLFLTLTMKDSFSTHDPAYIFVSELTKGSTPNSTSGINYFRSGMGANTEQVSKRLIPWLKSEKKICPPLG
jgi:hypothetical protein